MTAQASPEPQAPSSDPVAALEAAGAADARLRIAEALDDAAALRAALKWARGRDKRVYRVVKARLDALRAAERAADEARARAVALCEALERLARLPWDATADARLEADERQWRALEPAPDEALRRRWDAALEACRARRAAWQVEQSRAAAERERAAAQAERRGELLDALEGLFAEVLCAGPDRREATLARLAELQQAWREADGAADAAAARRFEALAIGIEQALMAVPGDSLDTLIGRAESGEGAALEALAALLERAAPLPAERRPPPLQRAAALVEAERARRAEAAAQRRRRIESVEKLLRRARKALTAGRSREALGLRGAIDQRLAKIERPPAELLRRIEALDGTLADITAWRAFATEPKKRELVERMEALVGAELPPEALAERIRELQREWREASKGSVGDRQAELWARFRRAAREAYRPCQAYFAARAEQMAAHLEARRALVAELEAYERAWDEAAPDWAGLAARLQQARRAWRAAEPCQRRGLAGVRAAYEAVSGRLAAKLAEHHERVAAAKEALITRARQLAESPDLEAAIADVKALQAQWKQLGPLPPRRERALWKRFREPCDALFARRDQAGEARRAERRALLDRANALCARLEALGAAEAPAAAEVEALRAEFEALALPRDGAGRAVQGRWRKAWSAWQVRRREQRRRAAEAAWEAMFEAADLLRRRDLALAAGDEAARTELEAAFDALLEGAGRWPAEVREAAGARRATPLAPAEDGDVGLRELAVGAEIAADLDSPEADRELRRARQLALLSEGLGGPRPPAERLIAEWLAACFAAPPVPDAAWTPVVERLRRARRRLIGA